MASFSHEDTKLLLRRMGDLPQRIVVVGGQAVNFWAEHYRDRSRELDECGPFTSKDVDFFGDRRALKECALRLEGRYEEPEPFAATPNAGVVIFHDHLGDEVTLDFLRDVFGVDGKEIVDMSIPVTLVDAASPGGGFRVMHPVHCLESRASNVVGLPGYDTPHAMRQLRASILSAREFLRDLLADGRVRDVLKLAKRIHRFCYSNRLGRRVLDVAGMDPFEAVPCEPPLPDAFIANEYPRMRRRLEERRAQQARSGAGGKR